MTKWENHWWKYKQNSSAKLLLNLIWDNSKNCKWSVSLTVSPYVFFCIFHTLNGIFVNVLCSWWQHCKPIIYYGQKSRKANSVEIFRFGNCMNETISNIISSKNQYSYSFDWYICHCKPSCQCTCISFWAALILFYLGKLTCLIGICLIMHMI